DFAGGKFGNDQLPEEFAGFFVETHQDAAVALMLRVARIFVVGANENFSAGGDDVAVTLRANFDNPLGIGHVAEINVVRAGLEIDLAVGGGDEVVRQIGFRG